MNYILRIAPVWMRELRDDQDKPVYSQELTDGWVWSDSDEAKRRYGAATMPKR